MKTSSILMTELRKVTNRVPISSYQTYFKRDLFTFYYHVVSAKSLPHIRHLHAYKSPEMFEHDLTYLLKNFNLISYEQFVAYRQNQIELKPNSVLLSFDDGYHECFTVARPLLKKYGVPCIFFITTDFVDNNKMACSTKVSLCIDKIVTSHGSWKQTAFEKLRLSARYSLEAEVDFIKWIKSFQFINREQMDWICETLEVNTEGYLKDQRPFMSHDELKILASEGFTIGAHSKSHPLLETLPQEAIVEEIVDSCQIIRDITRVESIPFSFPFHGKGLNRGMLADICSKNKVIGYLFDTDGIRKHKGVILDRIWADTPELDGSGESNLPGQIYQAYQDFVLGWLRKSTRIFPLSYFNSLL